MLFSIHLHTEVTELSGKPHLCKLVAFDYDSPVEIKLAGCGQEVRTTIKFVDSSGEREETFCGLYPLAKGKENEQKPK